MPPMSNARMPSKPLIKYPMSKSLDGVDALKKRVLEVLLWAPDDVIQEYKDQFLEMPVEVSRLQFFHPSNRMEWVNINRYCDFIRLKLFWSEDRFVPQTNRFWLGDRGQRRIWRGGIPVDTLATQPSTEGVVDDSNGNLEGDIFGGLQDIIEREIIVISSDEDEDDLEEIFRRLRRQRKVKEVIVVSSDDDEPLVETIVPRKRKAQLSGGSGQGAAKRRTQIRIFEPDVISVLDSDEEMTIVE